MSRVRRQRARIEAKVDGSYASMRLQLGAIEERLSNQLLATNQQLNLVVKMNAQLQEQVRHLSTQVLLTSRVLLKTMHGDTPTETEMRAVRVDTRNTHRSPHIVARE